MACSSGIGGKNRMERLGISVVVDLPVVGGNYKVNHSSCGFPCVECRLDHHAAMPAYLAPKEAMLDVLVRTEVRCEFFIFPAEESILCSGDTVRFQWCNQSPESLTHVSCGSDLDFGVKLRPTAQESEQLGAKFSERWNTSFADTFFVGKLCMRNAGA
ncbi:hypothetical protein C8J57DRAFT_1088244 [Mycena rebaudengoi]|nr:hypothetical protein C8J57DRAFT_1088244 [Mycena rebaudengoi]